MYAPVRAAVLSYSRPPLQTAPGSIQREISRDLRVVACFALLALFAACGGGGSGSAGSGGSGPPPASNPVPAIAALNPPSATAGGAAFTLTITGYNFVASSQVKWNGNAITATYNSSTQMQAQVSAAEIAISGISLVSVVNPAPGGGSSGSAEFVVNPTSNPAPAAIALNPASVNAGSAGFILTLYGSNFISDSVIEWNGSTVPTTFLSDTYLEAEIPASDVATPQVAQVDVSTPGPGGGISTSLFFAANFLPTVISQPSNDIVWDSTHQLMYLSVPSLAGLSGNAVAAFDPVSGSVVGSQFAGSEPAVLAVSDDGQFLYAGLDGASSVQRFTLPDLLPDIKYPLGAGPYPQGPYFPYDLEVGPGLPHTTAVSKGAFGFPDTAIGGMAIYDDATERPTTAGGRGPLYDSLAWGSDTSIYAINSEVTTFDFYVLAVNSHGVTQTKDYLNEISYFYVRMHYDSGTGLVYTDDGYVINPSNGRHVGNFGAVGYMVPDSSLNRAFFFGQTQFQTGTNSYTIESFDLTTFAPIAEIVIPNVQGYPLRFIRWGSSGLALNDDAGYIYLINNAFVGADGKELRTPQKNLFPLNNYWVKRKTTFPDLTRSNTRLSSGSSAVHQRSLNPQDSNPAPTISALSPDSVVAGGVSLDGFTLNVTGSNFVSLSVVQWKGTRIPTEFISTTQLQAQVSFSEVLNAGSNSVSVVTPGPGGGTSNTLPFTVVSQYVTPPPLLVSLYPNSANAGSSAFSLAVNGYAYFTPQSVVEWNGSPRPTSYYGPGQLQAQISAADLASAAYAQVSVYTPPPGGGISNVLEFQILYQPTAISQSINDMVWDPVNQVLYFSNNNQVCSINPVTQVIGACQAGDQPDVLAISDDSQFLYVGMDATGSVQRFVLPSMTPDTSYSLGTYENGSPYYALDLQVAPGSPHTSAVTKGVMYLDPAAQGGITIFDDATARPVTAPGGFNLYDSIQWSPDATAIYSANSESTSFDFYTLSVDASGVTLNQDYASVFWNPGRIHYDRGSGLVYSDDGFHAVDPTTGLPAGIFEVGGGWPMAPDSSTNTNFILAQYIWQEYTNYTIDFFDLTRYVPISQVPFSTTATLGFNPPGRFIRYGSNGLAVSFKGDKIYLLPASFGNSPHTFDRKRDVGRKKH